jgi:peptidoglycan LD-endopeptidase CwlK
MSGRLFDNDVLFLQRLLSCCGLYRDTIDGDWGPNTDAAEREFQNQCETIASQDGKFDPRSERNIRTLHIEVQKLCRESLRLVRAAGHDARVISGTRTYAEQNALFRQGRFGNAGSKVTNARGGQSWHNFGMAWDIGLFEGGQYVTRTGPYNAIAPIAKITGIEWGGDWRSFQDPPHYQVPGEHRAISAVRDHFERGGR